jgi:septal ring factor EnvC (AmiA/AmiB activator)
MPTKSVSNEDILELLQESIQMTAEHFDRLEKRIDEVATGVNKLERQYNELKKAVDALTGEQRAQKNDIKDILDRLLVIEKRLPDISELEMREMQAKLQSLIDWAIRVAEVNKIKLELPG